MAKPKSRRGRGMEISPIDIHVGARRRQHRTLLGMTQTNLGDALGVSFQQMQKYERSQLRSSPGPTVMTGVRTLLPFTKSCLWDGTEVPRQFLTIRLLIGTNSDELAGRVTERREFQPLRRPGPDAPGMSQIAENHNLGKSCV